MQAFNTPQTRYRFVLLLLCAAVCSLQGCVHVKRFSLANMWMDYNTLRAPAIFFEKREHFPYKADQVSLFHWQYGVTPGRNVKYVRPDLVAGNSGSAYQDDAVVNVSASANSPQAIIEPAPAVYSQESLNAPPRRAPNQSVKPPVPPRVDTIPPPPEPAPDTPVPPVP